MHAKASENHSVEDEIGAHLRRIALFFVLRNEMRLPPDGAAILRDIIEPVWPGLRVVTRAAQAADRDGTARRSWSVTVTGDDFSAEIAVESGSARGYLCRIVSLSADADALRDGAEHCVAALFMQPLA